MSFVKVLLSVPDSATTMANILQINTSANQFDDVALDTLIGDMIDGAQVSYTKVSTGAVQAVATLTSTGTATASDTAVIANVTLTAETSGSDYTMGQFDISATVAVQAANIAKAINMTPAFAGIVTATSALGVTTITAVQPGVTGNGLGFVDSLTNVSGVAFASGSDGSQVAVNYGRAS